MGREYGLPNRAAALFAPDPQVAINPWMLGDVVTAVLDSAGAAEPRFQAEGPRLLANAPNPFNATTQIHFSLAQAGWARLVVYNLAGQRVRHLADGVLPAGMQQVRWDGRDDRGRAVGSGVYLYRLEAEEQVLSRRMALVR